MLWISNTETFPRHSADWACGQFPRALGTTSTIFTTASCNYLLSKIWPFPAASRKKAQKFLLLNYSKICYAIYIVIRDYKNKGHVKEKDRERVKAYLPQVVI